MSKEYVEALETFNYIMARCKDEDSYIIKFPLGIQKGTTFGEDMEKAYKVIKQALLRLDDIDNSNPNEELEILLKARQVCNVSCIEMCNNCQKRSAYNSIKATLLKAKEQEKGNEVLKEIINNQAKTLEIVFEKGVDVGFLKTCETVEQYNAYCWNDEEDVNKKLTQEEFDILKRYFENDTL